MPSSLTAAAQRGGGGVEDEGKWDLLGSSLFWETLYEPEVVAAAFAVENLEEGFGEEEDEVERVEPARALR